MSNKVTITLTEEQAENVAKLLEQRKEVLRQQLLETQALFGNIVESIHDSTINDPS